VLYDRHLSDGYVLALGPTSSAFTTVSAAWHWRRPQSLWWADSTFSHFIDAPPGQPAPHTWLGDGTIGRFVGDHYAVVAMYSAGRMGSRRYVQDGRQYQLAQSGARVSFQWYPSARPARTNVGGTANAEMKQPE
jgi:hypothetical protein